MAVAPASIADKIIVLDDDEEEEASPRPRRSAAASSSEQKTKHVSPLRPQTSAPTHITKSPFATAKKEVHVLKAENEKLFSEFVEHCTPLTKDCPEVLTFLQAKHTKASPDFLSSVEFRNALGRCLTRAQANLTKTFVYINEICTLLRQHTVKKRQTLSKAEPPADKSGPSTSVSLKFKDKTKGKTEEEEDQAKSAAEEESTTSEVQEKPKEEDPESERKAKRALRKQIAYLENLLKVYNDEIYRLQQAELSLDDMETEDSTYIQEHKLKRKMMKIYEKLCELKGCNTLTGRVIEQRIKYSGTRYPELNKKIERFINSPEAHRNPPDYPDILQQVLRANERYNLSLSRKQLNQIAQDAFRETGSHMQERRHLDLVYNFGSRLTDPYKPSEDPALSDHSLLKRLRSNREVGLSRLEEVITKYAVRQDDTEEQDRLKRLEKDGKDKEDHKSKEEPQTSQANGVAEEEEEEEDEDDVSSDPDIEEEIQASTQQDAADEDENEEEENEAEQLCESDNKEDQTYDQTGSVSADIKEKDEELLTTGSPSSDETQIYPMSNNPSTEDSPAQSEPAQSEPAQSEPAQSEPVQSEPAQSEPAQSEPPQTDEQQALTNGSPAAPQQPEASTNQLSVVLVKVNQVMKDPAGDPAGDPAAETNGDSSVSVEQKTVGVGQCETQTTNGTSPPSPPPSPRTTRSRKRKREEMMSEETKSVKQNISYDSDADIPLDMGVISCNSPQEAEPGRASTPTQSGFYSSLSTPPPKKNKVNVATQYDPDEIIVLSDSE